MENKKQDRPDCYDPEKYNPYPLCVGNRSQDCKSCCLYVDFPEPPFDD